MKLFNRLIHSNPVKGLMTNCLHNIANKHVAFLVYRHIARSTEFKVLDVLELCKDVRGGDQ